MQNPFARCETECCGDDTEGLFYLPLGEVRI